MAPACSTRQRLRQPVREVLNKSAPCAAPVSDRAIRAFRQSNGLPSHLESSAPVICTPEVHGAKCTLPHFAQMSRRLKIFSAILALAALAGLAGYLTFRLPAFGGAFEGARLERMRQSPQYVSGRFENDPPYKSALDLVQNLRDYLGDEVREPRFVIPVLPVTAQSLQAAPAPGMRAIWFGHASVLVEIDGVRIMTDPVFAERVSPLRFIGPTRFHPPPIPLDQLTGIDAVVISHDHYDHLDMDSIRHLARNGTHFYVGLGIGAHLQHWEVPAGQIHEMDWWESVTVKGVTLHCTPARHYSGRKSMDNSTLWTSWWLKGASHSVYFSGDTGYAPHFAEIRKRLGAPDLALIKVGAYGDTWLDIHMGPEAAIQAYQDLGAKTLLPVHWATFNLAYHAWNEPLIRTLAAATAKGATVVTPRVGEPVEFGKPFVNQPWFLPGR